MQNAYRTGSRLNSPGTLPTPLSSGKPSMKFTNIRQFLFGCSSYCSILFRV